MKKQEKYVVGIINVTDSKSTAILEEYQKFFPSSVEIIMTYAALERVSYEGLMGFLNELPDALNDFINKDPDIIIVPSMTGSAIKGYEIVNKLEQRSGRAVLVPSLEIKKCLKTAGISRIAIVSAFGVELGLLEQPFFRNHNIWITNLINIFDDESQDRLRVDCIDNNRVIEKVKQADFNGAQAVLFDSPTYKLWEISEELQAIIKVPVLSVNQVMIYSSLKRLGLSVDKVLITKYFQTNKEEM